MALKCFKNMKKLKIRASNVTYSILAKIYQKLGKVEKVLAIPDEMKNED
jgi:pentatricopeptide repeat protein